MARTLPWPGSTGFTPCAEAASSTSSRRAASLATASSSLVLRMPRHQNGHQVEVGGIPRRLSHHLSPVAPTAILGFITPHILFLT
jgi:hypothetical protein